MDLGFTVLPGLHDVILNYNFLHRVTGSSDPTPCPAGSFCQFFTLATPTGLCSAGYYCAGRASSATPTDGTTGDLCPAGYCHAFVWLQLGLKRVLGYSDSGRCQTSTRYWRPTRVLGIYNDRRNLCFKVACGDYFKDYLTSAVITVTM